MCAQVMQRGDGVRVLLGASLALVLLAWCGEALCQEATLYVLPTSSYRGEVSSVVSPKIDSVMKERLTGRPKLKLIGRYSESSGKPANAAIQEGKDAYNSGIGLLVAENYEGAAKQFQRSVQLLEQNLAEVDAFEILIDAQLRMGLAFLKAGYDLDAKAALKAYANLSPTAKLDRKDYPEELVDQVEKEHRRMEKRGGGVLKVGSTPEGATVELDGQVVGTTPLELKDAPSGTHYLVVRGAGGVGIPFAQKITVQGKGAEDAFVANLTTGTPKVDAGEGPVFLVELERRVQAGEVDPSLSPYLKELSERVGARSVAFVVMRKGKGGRFVAWPFVYEASGDRIALLETVEFDASLTTVQVDGYKLSEAVATAAAVFPEDRVITANPFVGEPVASTPVKVAPGPVVAPGLEEAVAVVPLEPLVPLEPEGPPSPTVDEDKWYNAWWVWTGVSVLVVGGAVTGGVLLLGEDEAAPSKGFPATVSW